jgi:hypothetical protein
MKTRKPEMFHIWKTHLITRRTSMAKKIAAVLIFGLIAVSATAFATPINFTYSFVNTGGNVGATTDVVTGTIFALPDNTISYGPTTVTVDSVSPFFTAPFTVRSWTDYGTFTVSGGILTSASFSSSDGTFAINPSTGLGPYYATADWSKYYLGSNGSVRYTPVTTTSAVPEPTTMLLLGFGLVGLAGMRRKLKK